MLHSKVMIVDELYTLVGSANLDPRSLYINLEFLAVIRSAELARQMQEVCRFEWRIRGGSRWRIAGGSGRGRGCATGWRGWCGGGCEGCGRGWRHIRK